MPPHGFNDPGGRGDARRQLRERLERQEMGDEAYDRMVANHDDRPVKMFGILFIVVFAVIAFGAAALGW